MEINDLTYLINGCAMKVHGQLGTGFQKLIYERALEVEFREHNIKFLREEDQPILYKGIEIGIRRADFIVNESIVVELKAVSDLLSVHIIQTKNNVTAYNAEVGLLLNFGSKSLQIKKIHSNNSSYNQSNNKNLT